MNLWGFFSKKMTTSFLTDFLLLLQTPMQVHNYCHFYGSGNQMQKNAFFGRCHVTYFTSSAQKFVWQALLIEDAMKNGNVKLESTFII